MKIISKYKDFYDYFTQDYDADLCYVREPKYIYTDKVNHTANKITNLINNNFAQFSSYIYDRVYSEKNNSGFITITCVTFGIFPNVYKIPVICVADPTNYNLANIRYFVMSRTLVHNIMNTSNDNAKTLLIDEVKKLTRNITFYVDPVFCVAKYTNIKDTLRKCACKTEIKEVFYELNAPVFIRAGIDEMFNNTPYMEALRYNCSYVTNVCFNELHMNILKYFYEDIYDLNTYINIENFLWSVKQEPIANPDNKTKIVSHGFDLKTSFRKM